jgi:chromate transporter
MMMAAWHCLDPFPRWASAPPHLIPSSRPRPDPGCPHPRIQPTVPHGGRDRHAEGRPASDVGRAGVLDTTAATSARPGSRAPSLAATGSPPPEPAQDIASGPDLILTLAVSDSVPPEAGGAQGHPLEVLAVATRLGLTSFGGPVAHLGYFRAEYVHRRRWLSDQAYTDLVALCQSLPGPASSELGIAIGIARAGLLGGFAAWLGFTMPSAVALVTFAYLTRTVGAVELRWLHGLQVVAAAVVAQAVWSMARVLTPDRLRVGLALAAAVAALALPVPAGQVGLIMAGGIAGTVLLREREPTPRLDLATPIGRRLGATSLVALVALLVLLPLAGRLTGSQTLLAFAAFFRAGALVFGGGHVVLPLLQSAVVPPGWVTNQEFLTGYGAAQAVPGPLFTFSAYLGTVLHGPPDGVGGAALALGGMFLPSFLLVWGALPFWNLIRQRPGLKAALRGINATVVGLLLAALYTPVFTSAVRTSLDLGLALVDFGLLAIVRLPPWAVVLVSGGAGAGLTTLGVG